MLLLLMVVVSIGGFSHDAGAREQGGGSGGWKTMAYQGIPLSITIGVGQESILQFPWRVEMGSSSETLGMVRNVPVGDSVFLTPLMAFESQRFFAESTVDGSMFLIDITAVDDAAPQMIRFMDARGEDVPPTSMDESAATTPATTRDATTSAQGSEVNYATLTRYALQRIYSPERLVTPVAGMSESRLPDRDIIIRDLVPGEDISAKAAAEWSTSDGLFVTALLVRNNGGHSVTLDPRHLRHTRTWLASAYWSTALSPAGTIGDETTLVVVSTSPWRDLIQQRGGG